MARVLNDGTSVTRRRRAATAEPATVEPATVEPEGAEVEGAEVDDGLGSMTVPELQERARVLGLGTSGRKAELIDRIRAVDALR